MIRRLGYVDLKSLGSSEQLLVYGDVRGAFGSVAHITEIGQQLTPSDESARLLEDAQVQSRNAKGLRFLASGKAAYDAGSWDDAVDALTKAQQHDPTDEGARLLADAQVQIQRLEPASYRVTIHSAAILPFKPHDARPWDGLGGPMLGARDALQSLAAIASDPSGLSAAIASWRLVNDATSKPDCYAVVSVAGTYVSLPRQNTQHDTLIPVWNVPFLAHGANYRDGRIVNITVVDQDVEQDDMVGNYQVTLGDLVKAPVQELSLIDANGRLRAGGVVVLKVSAQRI